MPVDELDRVRRANPVPQPPPAPPLEQLRRRLDGEDLCPRRRIALRVALAATAVAALAVTLLAWPSGQPDVLAAVYRNTAPGPGTLHMRWRTTRYDAGGLASSDDVTVWSQPRLGRSRTYTRYVDHTTGRTTRHEVAVDGSVVRSWSNRRPSVVRESHLSQRGGEIDGVWDGGVGILRFLYRNGQLKVVGRTSDGRWELRGQPRPGVRLVAFVAPKTFTPTEIRQESDVVGLPGRTSLTVTRYSIFRRERGVELGLDLPGRRGLTVLPSARSG